MKRMTILMAMFFATAVIATSCKDDDDNNNTNITQTDKDFMIKAGYSNRDEIDFAQLALTNSSNDSVKNFAQMMITEHTAATASLDSIANRYVVTLPTTIDSMHAEMKNRLAGLAGFNFDTAYMNSQILDHNNAITLFQNEATVGNNFDVKNFATMNLPHLQMHLQRAQAVRDLLD
ncbi:MAG: DUF4142 domain-containing protein [Ferruginibacter sp.]